MDWNELKARARAASGRAREAMRRGLEGARPSEAVASEPPQADEHATPARGHHALKITGAILGALVLALIVLAAIWNWDWARGPVSRYASGRMHRPVHIDGHLKVHLLTWTPEIQVQELRVGNPAWAGGGDMARIPRLIIRVRLAPLFAGHLVLPLVEVDQANVNLFSDAQGRANWKGNPKDDRALAFPPVQHLVIRDSHVHLVDLKRRLQLIGEVNTSEDVTGSGRGVFRLQGNGKLNQDPFVIRVTGAPLIDVRRDRPYRFNAQLVAGPTQLAADGQIDRPFDLGHYRATLQASGRDLGDLYLLTGVSMPGTPPYFAKGQFSRDGTTYRLDRFAGHVGSSDLAGSLSIGKRKGRPFISGSLVSRSVDWKDLAHILGMAATAKVKGPQAGPPAPPGQKLQRLRSTDADVNFRATAVKSNRMQLSEVKLDLKLNDGVLRMDPLSFNFSQGRLNGWIHTDARKATPVTSLNMALSGYAVRPLLPQKGGVAPLDVTVNGSAALKGQGLTVLETLRTANGQARVTAPHGEIRQALAELLGIDAGKGLMLLLSKSQHRTDLRCAAADFSVTNGVMRTNDIVLDTGVVTSHGAGTINLNDNSLNFALRGQPKHPEILHVWAPIEITGTITHPHFGVDKAKVVSQGGIALALGALVNPLVAILPFVTAGGAKDVDCAALLAGPANTRQIAQAAHH